MKVILYASMSVNGFIARENDEEDFLSDENWFSFQKLAENSGCFVVGRRAYKVVKEKYTSGYNFSTLKAKPIILSRRGKNIEFDVARSPREAIKKAKFLGFKSLVVSGGSKTNASFLKTGLVNEIILNVEPFILGKGFPVFDENKIECQLKLKSIRKIKPGILQLHYKVKK
ncbi:MAG: dihydrofolate reductase family protein [Candidatus Aenigmatarchaeota archaeon]